MADRLIKVLENDRLITRGVNVDNRKIRVYMDEDEVLPFTVNYSDWLGTDTIASVVNETFGPTVTNESNTTTTALMTIAADNNGRIEQRITTAAGTVRELLFLVNSDSSSRRYPTSC